MLGILAFGGYIAYSGTQPNIVVADPPPIYRFIDVPKEVSVINLDLNKETLTVEGPADVEVNIQKQDPEVRTITKWKERIVEKPVVVDNRPMPHDVKPFVRQSIIPIPEVSNLNELPNR